MEIDIMQSVYERNETLAKELNSELTRKGIFCVNVLGAPGVGKTSSLIKIIGNLNEKSYVIEGDVESDIDTKKLMDLGINSYQVHTGGGCHLDSPLVSAAVEELKPSNGYLFIENIGNLICPADFLIGEHIKLLICNVTEGSDKPYKYPLAFEKAEIILVNKIDLENYVEFDRDFFIKGVHLLNKKAPIFFVSAKNGERFEEVGRWLAEKKKEFISK